MKIEVLGGACKRCEQFTQNIELAVRQMGLQDEVVRIDDPAEIAARGVWKTPTLMVDGRIEVIDAVPDPGDFAAILGRVSSPR
ncbi:MAG: hypothetical protein A3G34_06130 [Candidatus Lindowbacteria bacterium RIFCSPLOWO2_12_FULL_62_27]|nr:MAG: hypothetical protein A3G34_06130 [Candidatus Lindowbacteria bacterium RIFCSPLOWO2_12_FULL_62_27]OGH58752.1 MAG: hypothetical protein A3I06_09505 [Candidatus Lindowbacteria bacterium RIFCSPLOWO2_02_FULL_62_12]